MTAADPLSMALQRRPPFSQHQIRHLHKKPASPPFPIIHLYDEPGLRTQHRPDLTQLRNKIGGGKLLRLIGRYLRAGVELPDGSCEATPLGVPQGGPLSPLLVNIVLDPLVKELERRGHHFARYADDFVILVKSAKAAERVMGSVMNYVGRRNLIRLGIDPGGVHRASRSRKGYWRMSQNSLVRFALNNAYLKEQGVPELREIWIRLHYGDQPKPKGTGKLVT